MLAPTVASGEDAAAEESLSEEGRSRPERGRLRPFERLRPLGRRGRVRLERPRLWRVGAILAAVLFCVLMLLVAPGSMQVVRVQPLGAASRMPAWTRPCVIDTPPPHDSSALAFCARVVGRVVGSIAKSESGDGERHVLVTGGFHVTLVELDGDLASPPLGSRITAVGPLQRASYGLRELIALSIHRS